MVSYFQNHTVLGQASQWQFTFYKVSLLLLVIDNMLFLNQRKREYFSIKNMAGCEATLPTELPRPMHDFVQFVATQLFSYSLLLDLYNVIFLWCFLCCLFSCQFPNCIQLYVEMIMIFS